MAKKKMNMYQTLKINIFGKVSINDNEAPAVSIIGNRLVVNDIYCDLRTVKERYNPETKELIPSVVDNILCAESILTMHYGKRINSGVHADVGLNQKDGFDLEPSAGLTSELETGHTTLEMTTEHNISELPAVYNKLHTLTLHAFVV